MSQVMICLIGEQPAPNLLPIRHYRPEQVVLAYSKFTKYVRNNLENLLKLSCSVTSVEIDAYDIMAARDNLKVHLEKVRFKEKEWLFNLTGGTKTMALASFMLAQQENASVIYFQSESGKSNLDHYTFHNNRLTLKHHLEVAELISIDDHLKAYGHGDYIVCFKENVFEEVVFDTLKPKLSEIIRGVHIGGALDIDLVFRCGNQIGVAELKTRMDPESDKWKQAIDQLNTASQREFLGTYVKRFLIINGKLGHNNRELAKAHRITVIENLPFDSGSFSDEDCIRLVQEVKKSMGVTS